MTFLDFIYYNSIGFTLTSLAFVGIEFVSDPKNFTDNMSTHLYNVTDYILEKYVLLKDRYYEFSNMMQDKTNNVIVFNDTSTWRLDNESNVQNTTKHYWQIHQDKDKTHYLVKNISSTLDKPDFSPFMNFELYHTEEIGEETSEIQIFDVYDKLKQFFVKGNELDYTFMTYFMKYFYQVDLEKYESLKFKYLDNEFNETEGSIKTIHIII